MALWLRRINADSQERLAAKRNGLRFSSASRFTITKPEP
jgi:hypothetical protein